MRVNRIFILALALPFNGAFAADVAAPTIGDLSRVQAETIMYDAKAKRAAAKASMQDESLKAGDDLGQNLSFTAPSVVTADLPTVTGISGAAGRLQATFRYGNGTTVASKSGQQIPGGFEVSEVGIDRVVLTKGDRRIPLQFGVAEQPAEAQATPSIPAGMLPGYVPPPPSTKR